MSTPRPSVPSPAPGAAPPAGAAVIRPYRPARGLGNGHVQTILGKFLRPRTPLPVRRERIETPDGDFLDLDFVRGARADAPPVLVLHGLEGAASRSYIHNTFRALLEAGLAPVGLNFRGCSGEPNRTVRAYHSGETGDVGMVVDLLAERGGRPAGLVGYSLGGNVTLKLVGELGVRARERVGAAAAISVPFDLAAGADRIGTGLMGRIYTRYFMRSLLRKVELKADLLRDACDLADVRRARTLRQFDEAATAPLHGFESARDYYERSSSAAFIAHIRVPTLILHSEDDPFLPSDRIPAAAMAANPWVTPVITRRGGHVGFIEGGLRRPRFWAEETLASWLAATLDPAPARR
ncbi:MAG TPA: alpha/beta fold hydrolase [Longimicrobiales bacterium]|nr:alpha/beta fold hydrolase [Longimicrobiales bacterium]